jgi:hypothetical protein
MKNNPAALITGALFIASVIIMQSISSINSDNQQKKIVHLDSIIAFSNSVLKTQRQKAEEDSIRLSNEIEVLKKNNTKLEKEKNKIFYKYVTRRDHIDSTLVNANKGLNAKYRQLKPD